MKNKNLKQTLFFGVLVFIMVFSLNLALMDSTGMDFPKYRIAVFDALMVAVSVLIIYFPIILLALFAACGIWVVYLLGSGAINVATLIAEITGFFNWLYGYCIGYNYFESRFSIVFALMCAFLSTLIVTIIVFSGRGYFSLIALGTVFISIFWFMYVEKARIYLMMFLFASILLYSYNIYRKKKKEWQKEGNAVGGNLERNWIMNSSIILVAVIIITMLLPFNIKPVTWTWMNDRVLSVFPFIVEWRNDSMDSYSYGFNTRYNMRSAGYRNGSKLGGPVSLNPNVMLTFETDNYDTIYLRGLIKDVYTGTNWAKSSNEFQEYKPGSKLPSLEYSHNLPIYTRELRIRPQNLLTSTIFSPANLREVVFKNNRFFADQEGEAYFTRMITRNDVYTVKSIAPYVDEMGLKFSGVNRGISKTSYIEIPNNISSRTINLAREITANCQTDYDRVKAIESYLRENYKYNLKPSKIPENKEFVDYFLFEGKEGYCTYFATSMAILLRAVNIPCRYVEGFVSRAETSTTRNVRGTDAHAWVEVNFIDYGWISFEPTPAYSPIELRGYAKTGENNPVPVNTNQGTKPAIPKDTSRDKDLDIGEGAAAAAAETKASAKNINFKSAIFYLLLAALLLRMGAMYLSEKIIEMRIKKEKGRKFISWYIREISWYLKSFGIVMHSEDTLREFANRVLIDMGDTCFDIYQVVSILERISYSNSEIIPEEKKQLDEFLGRLKNAAIDKMTKVGLYFNLYVVGK